jgi:hypothetical protein
MRIKDYKKKCILLSITLIIVGTFISFAGFGLTGFDVNKFEETGIHKWYRTIQVDDGSYSYGIKFGKDFSIINIGN